MSKKYSVNVEDDQILSYEVDGITYDSLADVPDPEDRAKLRLLSGDADDFTPDDFSEFEHDEFFKTGVDKEFDQEIERLSANAPQWSLSKILLTLFAAISVLMLGIAAYSAYRAASSISAEVTTDGWVVDMIERKNSEGSVFYYPVVEFYLPDDRLVRAPLSEGSWPPAYMNGEAVTIAYNPQQPLEARIHTGAILTRLEWILPLITGILGVAFAGATALAWWIIKEDPSGPRVDNPAAPERARPTRKKSPKKSRRAA